MSTIQRGLKKAAISRLIGKIERAIACKDSEAVSHEVVELKRQFNVLEEVHNAIVDEIIQTEDIGALSKEDEYLDSISKRYILTLNAADKFTSNIETSLVQEVKWSQVSALPRLELPRFHGDISLYHSFMAVYNRSIGDLPISDDEKLTHLYDCLRGKARDAVDMCIIVGGTDGYQQALKNLKSRFGDKLTEKIKQDLCNGKLVKTSSELRTLADQAANANMVLKKTDLYSEIDTQHTIATIGHRLPSQQRNRWCIEAISFKEEHDNYPGFAAFVKFLDKLAKEAEDPVYGQHDIAGSSSSRHPIRSQPVCRVTNVSSSSKCILCDGPHKLYWCREFKKKKPEERLAYVNSNKLCIVCFSNDHVSIKCDRNITCKICQRKHSTYVHVNKHVNSIISDKNVSNVKTNNSLTNNYLSDHSARNMKCIVHMPLVQARINNMHNVVALLDTASTNTFIVKDVVEKLKLAGHECTYNLETLNNRKSVSSMAVDFELWSVDSKEMLCLSNVLVIDEIPCDPQKHEDIQSYDHLMNLPFVNMAPGDSVQILIGQDNAAALAPIKIAKGCVDEPYATQTMFGWSINGMSAKEAKKISRKIITNFVTTSLDVKVNQLWDLDDEHVGSDSTTWSVDDRKVVALWDQQLCLVDGHFQLPVPWKVNSLDNNYGVALCRLKSLKNGLAKSGLFGDYDMAVCNMFQKNFAERVPTDQINNENLRTWYLPHHHVRKNNGNMRLVFDCSSRYKGYCLNDATYQGPNLTNKLSSVLLRFRLHRYAVTADIESMFNQVMVPAEDRDALRFLWYTDDHVTQYRMTTHLFGGIWSSSVASYALQQCSLACDDEFIKHHILNSFYVDDLVASVKSVEEVCSLINTLKNTLLSRGFNLRKYVVNDEDLMNQIPSIDRSDSIDTNFSYEGDLKALGMAWDVNSDEFYFRLGQNVRYVHTKAGMLSVVASIFNPLGLVSPITITGMMLFQDATRLKIGWKEELSEELNKKWVDWLHTLSSLTLVRFSRCVKPSHYDDAFMELHIFCDASERAYGCSLYLRCVNKFGNIHISLICSKNKLAPLKTMRIPRLELQASHLAAKMDHNVRTELSQLTLGQSTFWSDSTIVLAYIKNTSTRYQVFVANRVSFILDRTSASQWHHISGKENPADLLTRGVVVSQLTEVWTCGPSFLKTHKSEWRNHEIMCFDLPLGDPEVKRNTFTHNSNVQDVQPITQLINHYSDWYRLERALIWIQKIKDKLLGRNVTSHINAADIQQAEMLIIKHVQQQFLSADVTKLSKHQVVHGESSLRKLAPRLDDDGIIVVSDRLKHANISARSKEPYIIPHGSNIATMIVRAYHDRSHHATEWTLSDIRQRYWITRGRSLVKRIIHGCITCKRLYSRPATQMMSDLPPERVTSGKPAFNYTGCDCFGPYPVKYGRAQVVRYGCICTCFTTRAIHLEKLDTLESDSFVNCFRRFTSRRGNPEILFSDNGTNFTGAYNQMKKASQEMMQSYFAREMIRWECNPSKASHFGGVWERMIHTVRRVLAGVLEKSRRLTDEVLCTLFCEVECQINGRPLTKVSDQVDDAVALTPNHLLLLRSNLAFAMGKSLLNDVYRARWRQVQYLADLFWRRWTREYITQLQRRSKWLTPTRNFAVGDLILMVDENASRALWPLALIIGTKVSRDGLVRSVRLKTTSSNELVRPISKIVYLEAFGEEVVKRSE